METYRGHEVTKHRVCVGAHVVELIGPARPEVLLDRPEVNERFEQDEYMPYWADLWPGALLLAEVVAGWPMPDSDDAPALLEIGCGLGLVGIVAAQAGHRVVMTDYDEDSLAFAAENARRNGVSALETRCLDWRGVVPDLRVDRIVAADVLYETRNLRPIAEFVYEHLAPGGFAVLCDPDRRTADAFDGIARHCGLRVETMRVSRDSGALAGRLFRLTPSS